MLQRDLTHCPSCGERVTAFAAGCSYCGAKLDTDRFRKASAGKQATTQLRSWMRKAAPRR